MKSAKKKWVLRT